MGRKTHPAVGVDESGQMMMLGAVILVVGFIALSGMVARVGQLGVQTGKEQQRPLLLEVHPMKAGVDYAIAHLVSEGGYMTDTDAHKAAYQGAIQGALEHLRLLEASRGFLLEYSFGCATPGNPATGFAAISLSDGELWVQVRSAPFVRASTATPC